jgi:hypothetical protein
MEGIQALQPPDAILKGLRVVLVPIIGHVSDSLIAYDWGQLAAGSLIVDVAGGVGTSCLTLAGKFPELKFVIQDLEGVVQQGKEVSPPSCVGAHGIIIYSS